MYRRFPARHARSLLSNQVKDLRPLSPLSHPSKHTSVVHTTSRKLKDDFLEERIYSEPKTSIAPASQSTARMHPWPEWLDLMETLTREGYFQGFGDPFQNETLGPKESNSIRTACLNFARDRHHIMGSLSTEHIRVIAECGCPTTDRKVVNSGKRLRAFISLDEGRVCSSCNLRGICERAFAEAQQGDDRGTTDVMRILLTYGLDPVFNTVDNRTCLNGTVKESVRNLLKQIVKCGTDLRTFRSSRLESAEGRSDSPMVPSKDQTFNNLNPGDWHCLMCKFLNFSRNFKCLRCDSFNEEKLRQIRDEQADLPLKRGDWICGDCGILNFSRNTRCWLCEAKPPARKLNPGEWECESCNFINFKRNAICLKCDHRRPKALNAANISVHRGDGEELKHEARNRGTNQWTFVNAGEGSKVRKQFNTAKEEPRFVDFPIIGGKSELSCDPGKREEWKLKMVEKKEGSDREKRGSRDGPHTRGIPVKLESPEHFPEDDDMTDWFGLRCKT